MDWLRCARSFVEVVDAGGFSAAERSGGLPFRVSSKQVRRLEESLGVSLLVRSTRSLSLTDAGRTYLEYCREVLSLVDDAAADVRRDVASVAGTLRVAMPPGYAEARGFAIVGRFLDAHPEVEVEVEVGSRIVDMVESRIDVALRLTRPVDSGLVAQRIADVPLAIVASPDCIARCGIPDHAAELAGRPCIVDLQHRFGSRWPLVEGHVEVSSHVRVRGAGAVRWFATRGYGFGLVPRVVVEDAIDVGALVEVLPDVVKAGWSLWAVTLARRRRTARTRAFLDVVRAAHPS